MRRFQMQKALENGQQLDRGWRATHLKYKATPINSFIREASTHFLCGVMDTGVITAETLSQK